MKSPTYSGGRSELIGANDHLRIGPAGTAYRCNKRVILGFTVHEVIGQAIINPRGLARGSKSIIVGK